MHEDLTHALRLCAEQRGLNGCGDTCRFGKEHPLNFDCLDYLLHEAADVVEKLQHDARRWELEAEANRKERDEFLRQSRELATAWQTALGMSPRWIPTAERLPDVDTPVLTITKYGHITDRILNVFSDGAMYFYPDGMHPTKDITHWMPLPKPPIKEDVE